MTNKWWQKNRSDVQWNKDNGRKGGNKNRNKNKIAPQTNTRTNVGKNRTYVGYSVSIVAITAATALILLDFFVLENNKANSVKRANTHGNVITQKRASLNTNGNISSYANCGKQSRRT